MRAYACVKAYACIDACMGVGDSKPERCIMGAALHILTSALTYTKHLHALSDAESEEMRALLDPHVNKSSTTTSGDTPQGSGLVVTTHTAPVYLHVLPDAVNGTVEALMDFNSKASAIAVITRTTGAVGPILTMRHRRRARRLRLRPSQHQSQRDAKSRRQIGRDGAWVSREQSRCSWDPPAHFREAPIRRYSGCPQPFPSSAGSQNAHAMLLGKKSPTAVPQGQVHLSGNRYQTSKLWLWGYSRQNSFNFLQV